MILLSTMFATALVCAAPRQDAAAPADDNAPPEVIRLKVGVEVVGKVIEFDEAKGVRVARVEDDSILDIGFDQMLPEDALRIRGARGYLPDEPAPLMVEAMKVTLMNGDEIVGIVAEQGTETIVLRQGTKLWNLKRTGIRDLGPVTVDALEVYDPEELYARELAARNPTTELDHYNLALYCESLQLWTRVKEQLAEVQTLNPQFKSSIVASKIKRADLRLESTEESGVLAKATRMSQRSEYDGALALIDDFLQKKPGSALRAEFEKTREVIKRQRDKWLKEQVIINFFTYIERFARAAASNPKVGVKEARKSIVLDGTTKSLENTAKWLKVPVAEIQPVWEDPKRDTVSPIFKSYGAGTFTLGVDAALKGLIKEDEQKKVDPKAGGPGAGNESLEDRIRKLIEQKKKEQEEAQRRAKQQQKNGGKGPQPQQQRGPEIADVPPTEDEWWNGCTADEKTQYLLAWWAEQEPHVKIIKIEARACSMCAGLGVIRFFDRGGEDKHVPCPRCKGLQNDRIVRYH